MSTIKKTETVTRTVQAPEINSVRILNKMIVLINGAVDWELSMTNFERTCQELDNKHAKRKDNQLRAIKALPFKTFPMVEVMPFLKLVK